MSSPSLRKAASFLLGLLLLISLWSCGGKPSESEAGPSPSPFSVTKTSPAPKSTAKPKASPSPRPKASPSPRPTATPEPPPQEDSSSSEDQTPDQSYDDESSGATWVEPSGDKPGSNSGSDTQSDPSSPTDYIGSDINSFYAAFGHPGSSEYSPSSIGVGESGVLYYPEFTVYTYRADGLETIERIG